MSKENKLSVGVEQVSHEEGEKTREIKNLHFFFQIAFCLHLTSGAQNKLIWKSEKIVKTTRVQIIGS